MSITNGYCTLAEIKQMLGITDTNDDTLLEIAVNAASRQIDHFCGQRFWVDGSVVAREFYADGTDLEVDLDAGISSTTGLVVKVDQDGDGVYETTLTNGTDFLLQPTNAPDLTPVQPWTSLRFGLPNSSVYVPWQGTAFPAVQITAKWGWPAVPDDVKQACLIQAAQLFKAKDAVFGVAAFGDLGVLRVQASLNPTAASLLQTYQRPAVG